MKNFLSAFFVLLVSLVNAQQHYPLFTQNYSNPFLVNPSFITLDRRFELNATFRDQWSGVENGPKTYQFDIQYPVDPKISLAVNMYHDKTVLLLNSGAALTFGYHVRLSSHQVLGFGLSGAIVSNRFDLEGVPDVDLIDPVLRNSNNNTSFDSNFGLHYRFRGLTLGFALLNLIDTRPFGEGAIERQEFDRLRDKSATIMYKARISPKVELFPMIHYRSTFSGIEYLEGSLLLNYNGVISFGGGYRTDFGPHAMVRIQLRNFQAGYSYDVPTSRYGGSTGSTSEFQMKYQFNKTVEPLIAESEPTRKAPPVEDAVAEQEDSGIIDQEPPVADQAEPKVEKEEVVAEIKAPEKSAEVVPVEQKPVIKEQVEEEEVSVEDAGKARYQLVMGVFSKKYNAERFVRSLAKEGIQAEMRSGEGGVYYYVTIPAFAADKITIEKLNQIRRDERYRDAWFKRFN